MTKLDLSILYLIINRNFTSELKKSCLLITLDCLENGLLCYCFEGRDQICRIKFLVKRLSKKLVLEASGLRRVMEGASSLCQGVGESPEFIGDDLGFSLDDGVSSAFHPRSAAKLSLDFSGRF